MQYAFDELLDDVINKAKTITLWRKGSKTKLYILPLRFVIEDIQYERVGGYESLRLHCLNPVTWKWVVLRMGNVECTFSGTQKHALTFHNVVDLSGVVWELEFRY